jgi:hypothetical protein
MSEYPEQTIGNAIAKVAPALGGATIAGLGPDQWAMVASILTVAYVAIMIWLALPRLIASVRTAWRKLLSRKPAAGAGDGSDQAGA